MSAAWGADFDPDELARLETRMWKAYYRRQPARLFVLLIEALHAQARVSWPRTLAASLLLTRAAAGFARSSGDYERFAPDIGRAYRLLGLPEHVDAEAVARHELRWWVVRRELGLASGARRGRRDHGPVRGDLRRPARTRRRGRPAARPGRRGPRPRRDATIRTARAARAGPTGRRSPACCATRIGACTTAWRSLLIGARYWTQASLPDRECWRLSLVNGSRCHPSSGPGGASRPARPSGRARPARHSGTGSTTPRSRRRRS